MGKYSFFGKVGRPTKEETKICKKIQTLLDDDVISASEVEELLATEGTPATKEELETLYSFLTGESTDGKKGGMDASSSDTHSDNSNVEYDDLEGNDEYAYDDIDDSVGGTHGGEGLGQDAVGFDPFKEPVVERGYTQGFQAVSDTDEEPNSSEGAGTEFDDNDFEEPQGESVADKVGASAEDGDIPNQSWQEEDIPEPDYVQSPVQDAEYEESNENLEDDSDGVGSEKLGGDNLEDLTPAQKRKSAEKTAEAILDMYCKFSPLPFKKWASISEGKVQKMVFNDEINTKMPIENGVTVQDYIEGVNEQVDEVFTVDDDTRESIKDPLIDVLMEQELALTPTQRLLMAVGSHVVTMGFSAFQLAQNNKQALETFKQFHSEQKGRSTTSSSSRTSQSDGNPKQPRPRYSSDDIGKHEEAAVEELMNELNNDGDDVIDPDHDPSITVTETTDD